MLKGEGTESQGLFKVNTLEDSTSPLPWIPAFAGMTNAQFWSHVRRLCEGPDRAMAARD